MDIIQNRSITGRALQKVIQKYIPNEFIKNVNFSNLGFDSSEKFEDGGVALLQKLIDNSTDDIRFFGCVDDLNAFLHTLRCFPSNHRFFGFDITEEYNNCPMYYINEKQEKFIYKQDLFVILQKHIFEKIPKNIPQMIYPLIMVFLKTNEEKLNECCEFIKYDPDFVKKFQIDHFEINEETNVILLFKNECFWDWNEEKMEPIKKILEDYQKLNSNEEEFSKNIDLCLNVIKSIRKFIDSNPEKFRPNSDNENHNNPMVLRVFNDDGRKFVFATEIFKAIYPNHKDFKDLTFTKHDGFYKALYLDSVKQHFSDRLAGVELINVCVDGSGLNQVPIMTPFGDYCILANHAHRFVFHYLNNVLKVFQKIRKDQWKLVDDYMEWLQDELQMELKFLYLVTMDKLDSIIVQTAEYFKEFENIETKSIRNVRKIGITLSDFKKELKYLGYVDVLPECVAFAEKSYNEMMTKKEHRFCDTRELCFAISNCMELCVFMRYSEIFSHFLFAQSKHKVDEVLDPNNFLEFLGVATECFDILEVIKDVKEEDEEETNDEYLKQNSLETEQSANIWENEIRIISEEKVFILDEPSKSSLISFHIPNSIGMDLISRGFEIVKNFQKSKNPMKWKKIQISEMKNSGLEAKIDEIEKVKEKMKMKLKEERKRGNDLKNRLISVENGFNQAISDKEKLTESVDQLSKSMKNVKSQLEAEKQKTHKMQKSIEELIQSKEESDQIISDMKSEKEEIISDNEKLINKLTESENKLMKKVKNLELQLKNEKMKTKKVESDAEEWKMDSKRRIAEAVSEYKRNIDDKKSGVIRELNQSLENQKAESEKTLTEKSNKIQHLSEKIDNLEEKLEDVKARMNQEKTSFQRENERRERELQEVIESYELTKESMEEEIQMNRSAFEDLEYTRGHLTMKNGVLESLLEAEKKKTKELVGGAMKQLDTLKNQMASLVEGEGIDDDVRDINEQLQTTNFQLSAQINQQNQTIRSLLSEITNSVRSPTTSSISPVESDSDKTQCSQKWFQQNYRDPSEFPPLS